MEKGFLILVCTFLVVGIIHVVSMKMTKISEAKKSSYRKLFWYLYGAFFCLAV
jgi:TRAP-type mannitol/chloroaromatic compound transport system permease small subunit